MINEVGISPINCLIDCVKLLRRNLFEKYILKAIMKILYHYRRYWLDSQDKSSAVKQGALTPLVVFLLFLSMVQCSDAHPHRQKREQ